MVGSGEATIVRRGQRAVPEVADSDGSDWSEKVAGRLVMTSKA